MKDHIWKEVPVPAKKADYRYKHLRLLAEPPLDGQTRISSGMPLPIQVGDVAEIINRRCARDTWGIVSIPNVSSWGDIRVLELRWKCPHCDQGHPFLIPENWITEGKAVFVEKEASHE